MDQYALGVALAVSHLAELRRQADRWRLASRIPGRATRGRGSRTPQEEAMLTQHHHEPRLF